MLHVGKQWLVGAECRIGGSNKAKAKAIGLFSKIQPGKIYFSPTRRRNLSTFYFFANHMKDLLTFAINNFYPDIGFM